MDGQVTKGTGKIRLLKSNGEPYSGSKSEGKTLTLSDIKNADLIRLKPGHIFWICIIGIPGVFSLGWRLSTYYCQLKSIQEETSRNTDKINVRVEPVYIKHAK